MFDVPFAQFCLRFDHDLQRDRPTLLPKRGFFQENRWVNTRLDTSAGWRPRVVVWYVLKGLMYQWDESMRIWSKSKSRSERIDDALPCSSRAYFWGSRIESEAGEDCDFFTTNLGIKLFQSIYPGDNGELICDKHPITTQGGFNLHLY